jgi:glyoxylate reductase
MERTMKYRVYITNRIPEESLEALEPLKRIALIKEWKEGPAIPYRVLKEEVKDIDGLLCMLADKVDAGILEAAPRLKVISNHAVGFDNIDIAQATLRGIPVGNTPGVLSETTADLAFALMMAAARRIAESDRYVRNGQWKVGWQSLSMLGQDIHHATLGIVGMGRIGAEVARRARGFRMRILYSNRHRREDIEKELGIEYVSLPVLLSESDFVSLHVPLNESTNRMISKAELALMKPTAIIINTARGRVIDQQALYEALQSGKIGGAGLDVTEIEPIPPDNPLLKLDNVVFTPHIGSATVATRNKMAAIAVENLIAGLNGERLPHCVNPEVYRHGRDLR